MSITEDEKQALRIKEGHRMLARAEQLKRDGQIKDYHIFVLESNPEVIDTLQFEMPNGFYRHVQHGDLA